MRQPRLLYQSPQQTWATLPPRQVLREFDERLRGFQHNVLQGGALSFGSRAFAEAFGDDVARFFSATATGDPERCTLLDSVLAGSSNLRKHFAEAPPGSERVVMAVVSELVAPRFCARYPRSGFGICQGRRKLLYSCG